MNKYAIYLCNYIPHFIMIINHLQKNIDWRLSSILPKCINLSLKLHLDELGFVGFKLHNRRHIKKFLLKHIDF